ncbi:LemA family protein [bacterium]|nr:LemA family protein [bacterium]
MNKTVKIILIISAILIAIVFMLAMFFISGINKVVTLDEGVKSAWAQVENVLQRRADLIPNYVETVKGYAKHEKDVFIKVTQARSQVSNAGSISEKISANNQLSSALSRLLVVVERYPELKANTNFIRLQDELSGTENRIAVERKRYNESVKRFNAHIRRIPGKFFAALQGLTAATYFEVKEEAKEVPKVSF